LRWTAWIAGLFKQLGLDYAALDDPDARFPQDSMTRLWQLAVELSGNPAIGLNMGKVVRPASFHVAGYALMSSRTWPKASSDWCVTSGSSPKART
jgi:hypothetical protein